MALPGRDRLLRRLPGFAAGRKHAEAVKHLRRAVQAEPQNPDLRFELALQLEVDGEPDEALAQLHTAARLDPQNARPHAALGVMLLNAQRVDEAIDELRAATVLDPHNSGFQAALGQALSRQGGRVREAEAAYQTALRLRPSEEGAFAGLTFETGVEQIMLDEVKQIEAEVRQKPNSADAHLRLALACAYAGNDAEARQEIQRSIELKPSNGPAHLVQARLDYLRGQYAAADTELQAAKAAGVTPRLDFVNAIHRKLGRQPAN